MKTHNTEVNYPVPFFQCPNAIFDDEKLKTYEKLVYVYICRCGNNSTAFPSYNTIAKKCSISRMSAIRAIDKLCEDGYILKKQRYNGYENYSNVYEINIEKIIPSNSQILPSNLEILGGSN